MRSWVFSLRGFSIGDNALGGEIGIQIGAVIPNTPPDADKSWPTIAVPPLGEFFHGTQNTKLCVFRKEDSVLVKNFTSHLELSDAVEFL